MKHDYELGNYYFVRRPSLDLSIYRDLFINNKDFDLNIIKENCNYNFIEKAIFFSSRNLYNSLKENYISNKKINDSLAKYLTRMTTRSTPYGLLSGVNLINKNYIKNNSKSLCNKSEYKWYITPDSSWIDKVVHRLQSNFDILIHLNVKINNTISISNNEAINLYPKLKENLDKNSLKNTYLRSTYKLTSILDYIYKNAQNFIEFGKLYKDILEISNNDISSLDIFNYIYNLIEKKILITNLSPQLNGIQFLEQILNVLENNSSAQLHYKKLLNIYKRMLKINSSYINEIDISFLLDTETKMKDYIENNDYFNITLKIDNSFENIPENKILELTDLLTYLTDYTLEFSEKKRKIDYKNKFLERYGRDREVLLIELIDPKIGLDFPNFFGENTDYSNKIYNIVNDNLIYKISETLANNEKEIDIRDLLPKIEKTNELSRLAPSCELLFIIAGKNYSEIDQIWLSPIIGSTLSGKTPGRFVEALDNESRNILIENGKNLESIYKYANNTPIQLDINHHQNRILNIVSNQSYYDKQLQIGFSSENSSIDLNSLIVGLDEGGEFYIREKNSLNKIKFSTFNNLNSNICPKIYQMLLFLSEDKSPVYLLGNIAAILEKFPIHPRIVYKNIIIFPSKYTLYLENHWSESFNDFKKHIKDWISIYTNDNLLYLKEGDNRLLINISNNTHLQQAFHQIKKNKKIVFNEVETSIKTILLEKNEGSVYEVCLPFIYKNLKKDTSIQSGKFNPNNDLNRKFLPLDRWIYLKIYPTLNNDEFISKVFNKIYNDVLKLSNTDKCFYIQYIDDKPYIRLRINSNLNFDINLLSYTKNLINYLSEKKLVDKVIIDTYERESERYGGYELIDSFESFSSFDSKFSAELLKYKLSRNSNIPIENILVLSIIDMINIFEISYEVQENLFLSIQSKKHNETYRSKRKEILNIIKNRELISEFSFYSSLQERNTSLSKYYENIKKENKQIQKNNILMSLIHIHCNRILGPNRYKENEIMFYLKKTLQSLKYI